MVRKTTYTLILCLCCLLIKAQSDVQTINKFLNDWHHAAAVADEDVFFGSMSDSGIYIGTDKSERWKRDELKEWSKEFFDRESAWDFKPYDRDVHIHGETVWFSELLDTWMGVCRGSGILRRTSQGWLIEQYHLSVTIDNDKVESFLKLNPN